MVFIEIDYENEKLKRLFVDMNDRYYSKGLLKKRIGPQLTAAIKTKVNEIESYDNFFLLQQFCTGKIESLIGDLKGCYSLRLTANYRLIIKPKAPDFSPESLIICKTVIIKGVIDYHDRSNRRNWLIP